MTTFLLAAAAGAQSADPPADPLRFDQYHATIADLRDPHDVAVTPDGRILVADTGRCRVAVFDRDGKPLRHFGRRGPGAGAFLAPTGLAIDPDGHIYVSDPIRRDVQVFDPAGHYQRTITTDGFQHPDGLAATGTHLAVADPWQNGITLIHRDTSTRQSISKQPANPPTDASLREPRAVALDPNSPALFLADALAHRIRRYDAAGNPSWTTGDFGAFPGLFSRPTDVDVFDNSLFVTDGRNHRIQVFDLACNPLYYWGVHALRPREGEGKLHYPRRMAIAPDGTFAVICETFEDRCQIFRPSRGPAANPPIDIAWQEAGALAHYGTRCDIRGTLLAVPEPDTQTVLIYDLRRDTPILIHQLGGYGAAFGRFNEPTDVCFSGDGTLFVADSGNRRIQQFRLDHDPGAPPRFDFLLARLVRAFDLRAIGRNAPGLPDDATIHPDAIEIDGAGNLFILDARLCRVFVFDPAGKCLATWGGRGAAEGRFRRPTDFAFSPTGRTLYVVDAHNHRIQAFEPDGRFVTQWGNHGTEDGAFHRPFGVLVDRSERVIVTDAGRNRVQAFDATGRLLAAWGSQGVGAGELFKPAGIAEAPAGRLLVIDHGNHRGQFFTPDGKFVSAFGARLFVQPTRNQAAKRSNDETP